MLIDERLRDALQWDLDDGPAVEADLLDVIVGRAVRRRRIRAVVVSAGTAVAAALIAFAVPWGLISRDDATPPADNNRQTFGMKQIRAERTPIDGAWSAFETSHAAVVDAVAGTAFQHNAESLYARLFTQSSSDVDLDMGSVVLHSVQMATRVSHTLGGMYAVQGRTVVMRLSGLPGQTRFRWHISTLKHDHVAGAVVPEQDRLDLTFLSTSVTKPVYGAPAEAFFRVWAANPFYLHLRY